MCTDFLLLAEDASVVNGRTMEFGQDLASEILIGGRGTEKHSPRPDLKDGLHWKAQYGYVGLNAFGKRILTDGMNEKGLSIGALWLPGSRYRHTVSDPSKALVVDLFVSWALAMCATVEEVKQRLHEDKVEIWGDLVLEQATPLHFPIHDESGRSIVIEFIDGQTMIHDNPVAVLTNDPPFPWQLTNIENYVGLSRTDAEPIEIGLKRFQQTGHGSGMRGVPGDSTPPSRFIRTVFQKHFALRPKTAEEACNLAIHLLNGVDIPMGTSASRPKDGKKVEYDYTQWIVIKALRQKVFNVRTYTNPTLMQIDLKKLDLSQPGERLYPLPKQPTSINITESLAA